MATNKAVWLPSAKAVFEIKSEPFTHPKESQILIKTRALAINPIDAKIQKFAFFPLQYPVILGQDVAGEVVEIGPGVTRFKTGDRVVGLAAGSYADPEQKAFQEYVVLRDDLASHIPESTSYENAVVLPLGVSTATVGLFSEKHLSLKLPNTTPLEISGKVLLVWGGASSVGSNAIQLAVAAGYEVFTTCSAKNFEYVKGIGASKAFDYKSPTIVEDIIATFENKTSAGIFDAIGGTPVLESCIPIIQGIEGKKYIATVLPTFSALAHEDIILEQVQALSIKGTEVGKAVWEFLESALKAGTYKTVPEPLVVGVGLKNVQKAVEIMSESVSARKVVVLL